MSDRPAGGGPPTLAVDDAGRATIRLQRPDKRNRIEPADLAVLAGHLVTASVADPAVRVLVLEAEGPSWCSGYHLGALAEGERATVGFDEVCDAPRGPGGSHDRRSRRQRARRWHRSGRLVRFRVGAEGIVLGMPAARIGLQYYASGLRRFVERIGPTPPAGCS